MMAIVPFPSMSPTLSLILTIGSNDRLLRRCVNALASQTIEDVELIVADCSFCGYADALRRKLPRVKGNIAVKFIEGRRHRAGSSCAMPWMQHPAHTSSLPTLRSGLSLMPQPGLWSVCSALGQTSPRCVLWAG